MDIYAENILDHYRHPRHAHLLEHPTVEHEEVNLSCGDTLRVQLQLQDDIITAVGWVGTGCAISQAGMSLLSEELEGKTLKEIEHMKRSDIDALLGVPVGPRRFKCALLCLHTVKNALLKSQNLPPRSWLQTVELAEK